jgi:hypothetical protein
MRHHFIFSPGHWIGEGRISFSSSADHFRFYTKWTIDPLEEGKVTARQQIEIQGGGDHSVNQLLFSNIVNQNFQVELVQALSPPMHGKGILDEKTIAWEFRNRADFEGFEVYELQENGDYMLHAEYLSGGQFRTLIDGRIWKKST